jgi:hypothetical protein
MSNWTSNCPLLHSVVHVMVVEQLELEMIGAGARYCTMPFLILVRFHEPVSHHWHNHGDHSDLPEDPELNFSSRP